MLYILTSKKISIITYYISFHFCYFRIPGVFHCDNNQEFKNGILIFLEKHDLKLIAEYKQHVNQNSFNRQIL